jgi:hypothetical protein
MINVLLAGSVPVKRIDFEQTNEFRIVDSLIAAAREEGVAEGAEKERMRIWMLRDMVSRNPDDEVIFVPVKALMLPAPTKEREP